MAETALAIVETIVPLDFFKAGAHTSLLDQLEKTVKEKAKGLDVSTPGGREAIRSLAAQVGKTKTGLEKAGKELVEATKKAVKLVDIERGLVWDRVQALQDEVRKPLTDFENAEKERCATHEANIAAMESLGVVDFGATIPDLRGRIEAIKMVTTDRFQEFTDRAKSVKDSVLSGLETKLKIAEKHETDRIEMERLQREAEERRQKDREEQIAREAQERERQRQDQEKQRIEQEKFAAEARAKQAESDKAAQEKRHAEELEQASIRAARETEQAVERMRSQQADDKRRAELEAEARQKDTAHRKGINNAALADFMEAGLSEECAKQAVKAIALSKIRAVTIHY